MPTEQQPPRSTDGATVLAVLEREYRAGGLVLSAVYEHPQKAIYRAFRREGPAWVVRLFPPTRPLERVRGDAAVLRYVARYGVAAERVVPAADGADAVSCEGRAVLVTECIAGARPDRSPATLRRLGEWVGRLHALPPVPEGDPLLRRRAGALPASDLPFGLQCLDRVADRVPLTRRAEYRALRATLLASRDGGDLPPSAIGLIHNDCHLANALQTADGDVVFFDWDGSGQGPRVAALGLLLYSCAVQAPDDAPLPPDLGRVDHLLDGYGRHHALTDAELELLPDAVRYRPAVIAARTLLESIDRHESGDPTPQPQGWWQRYAEAEDVAVRAREILARRRSA